MANVKVLEALDLGNDVLQVAGTVEDAPFVARGWMSAMTNHYDAEAYGEDGHRKPDAEPREMSDAEKLAYMRALLETQSQVPAAAATPIAVPKE